MTHGRGGESRVESGDAVLDDHTDDQMPSEPCSVLQSYQKSYKLKELRRQQYQNKLKEQAAEDRSRRVQRRPAGPLLYSRDLRSFGKVFAF